MRRLTCLIVPGALTVCEAGASLWHIGTWKMLSRSHVVSSYECVLSCVVLFLVRHAPAPSLSAA